MHPLARLGAVVGREQEDLRSRRPAARTMPSLRPNFIFRGARLATQINSRPTSCSGL